MGSLEIMLIRRSSSPALSREEQGLSQCPELQRCTSNPRCRPHPQCCREAHPPPSPTPTQWRDSWCFQDYLFLPLCFPGMGSEEALVQSGLATCRKTITAIDSKMTCKVKRSSKIFKAAILVVKKKCACADEKL